MKKQEIVKKLEAEFNAAVKRQVRDDKAIIINGRKIEVTEIVKITSTFQGEFNKNDFLSENGKSAEFVVNAKLDLDGLENYYRLSTICLSNKYNQETDSFKFPNSIYFTLMN